MLLDKLMEKKLTEYKIGLINFLEKKGWVEISWTAVSHGGWDTEMRYLVSPEFLENIDSIESNSMYREELELQGFAIDLQDDWWWGFDPFGVIHQDLVEFVNCTGMPATGVPVQFESEGYEFFKSLGMIDTEDDSGSVYVVVV